MLWRTAYSATQRRRAKVFRPATAAAHITYDRHISKRQSLNAIFTRVNPNIGINKCPACRSGSPSENDPATMDRFAALVLLHASPRPRPRPLLGSHRVGLGVVDVLAAVLSAAGRPFGGLAHNDAGAVPDKHYSEYNR